MSFPKKPDHLKVVTGSRRPTDGEHVQLPMIAGAPTAPDWLCNAFAVKEWNRLAGTLAGAGLLSEPALVMFAHYCNLHGRLVQLSQAGMDVNAAAYAQLRALGNDFGLTALGAQKLKPVAEPEKQNKFAKFKTK